MRVVEALKILEDLKDMLTDKSALINEIITSKQEALKDLKKACNFSMIANIADVYKECGEHQSPFCLNQNYSDSLDLAIKDSRFQQERKLFR